MTEDSISAEWSAFDKARLNNGVPDLVESLARVMLSQVEEQLGTGRDTKSAMEFVLDLNEVWNESRRHAYKSYFGYAWGERRHNRIKGRDEREFAPLDQDGNQY